MREIEDGPVTTGIQPTTFGSENRRWNAALLAGRCVQSSLMGQKPPRVPGFSSACWSSLSLPRIMRADQVVV